MFDQWSISTAAGTRLIFQACGPDVVLGDGGHTQQRIAGKVSRGDIGTLDDGPDTSGGRIGRRSKPEEGGCDGGRDPGEKGGPPAGMSSRHGAFPFTFTETMGFLGAVRRHTPPVDMARGYSVGRRIGRGAE